ncbi:mmr1/hsr1 GTP binding protein, putative [Entamoeba dispar SAW760]|uniref:Guanine nucleotide-binding protein-like 1 n=1 Tax=Entamoeba dispar (strain ATCC PRA-260 / SAW760) TaxID=370354 RepID=B0ECY3_ENTDS|nr:mmr1/hsr1 GTP binding protein, putative [Entamoeba dispar SAW760]EDR27675.1 mmr1/hsr1 GTP binding protein, putative [Entamoeba dispar SAW760]|eukprot:EDR27675.1 mmr1/hsr1 GTP binding protein, putative [Entamoeba dispar SAW760]
MKSSHKRPFSGKQKKQQLSERRERKRGIVETQTKKNVQTEEELVSETKTKLKEQIFSTKRDLRPKLLGMETKEEIDERKKLADLPIDLTKRVDGRTIPLFDITGEELDIITRPPWNYDMTAEELDQNEKVVFEEWITKIIDEHPKNINYFESNLETWRQLWRVVERSQVVLMIVDVRFGCIQFNRKVAEWVKSLNKGFGVILNKSDLVDERIVLEWQEYFLKKFEVKTLYVKTNQAIEGRTEDWDLESIRNEKKKEGGEKSYVKTTLQDFENFVMELKPSKEIEEEEKKIKQKEEDSKKIKSKESSLVVGLIGNPNVGKSSLLNWLVGKKVTSVSSHPGRTKYLQTYNMNKRITLADCPGMMFPMINQSQLIQVICGIYPLSQLREPYSIVRFFLERLPLDKIYSIELTPNMTVMEFVEAYAQKKSYITGKAGRFDTHKAAREILTDCIRGRIVFMFEPPKLE